MRLMGWKTKIERRVTVSRHNNANEILKYIIILLVTENVARSAWSVDWLSGDNLCLVYKPHPVGGA